MKVSKKIRLALTFSMVVGIVSILWVCSAEKIGLQEPSSATTSEIVAGLANARTQLEAETAVENLLDKTGVGRQIRGSRYIDYFLPDGFVSDLAKNQLLYLDDNNYALTWGEVFEIEQIILDDERFSGVDFESVVTRFRQQANTALLNSEAPENAMLIAMAADGANMPRTIPLYRASDIVSPVQDFLFKVWLAYEFQSNESFQKKIQVEINFPVIFRFATLRVECDNEDKGFIIRVFRIEAKCQEQLDCLRDRRRQYLADVRDCFRQFRERDKDCGNVLQPCLEGLIEDFLQDMQACTGVDCPHDQGGGN